MSNILIKGYTLFLNKSPIHEIYDEFTDALERGANIATLANMPFAEIQVSYVEAEFDPSILRQYLDEEDIR